MTRHLILAPLVVIRLRYAAPIALGILLGCTHSSPQSTKSEATTRFPSTWRFATKQAGTRAPHAMVVSNSSAASAAGLEILRQGGNAVDAAVAMGFALAVTLPAAGNLGGGGFLVLRLASGETAALDFRETAPRRATPTMYLDSTGAPTDRSRVGALASGVPGSVAGLTEALRRYGTLPLTTVMAPAVRLARDGFVVDSALSRSLASARELITRFTGGSTFFPGDSLLAPGAVLRQPALARTLIRITAAGAPAFYQGPIAAQLVAEMHRGGGIITHDDLTDYRPVWRTPLEGSYRGHAIITTPLPSSGGIALLETLNVLELYHPLPPLASARGRHIVAEAFRRAFIDRNTRLGDPDFVDVPVAELISKPYAAQLAGSIQPNRATPTPAFGRPVREGTHTTSYSVVDSAGNATVVTTTLNSSYGSGVFIAEAGFFLNNEMDDFAAAPGRPNQFGLVQGARNAIAPGKRMLSSMTPTIVLDTSGPPLLVLGAAGGPTIATSVAQIILDVIDTRMGLADAMAAPRIHHQGWPDTLFYEVGGLTPAVQDSLSAMGYRIAPRGAIANVNAILRTRLGWEGVSEPRYATTGAAGY